MNPHVTVLVPANRSMICSPTETVSSVAKLCQSVPTEEKVLDSWRIPPVAIRMPLIFADTSVIVKRCLELTRLRVAP